MYKEMILSDGRQGRRRKEGGKGKEKTEHSGPKMFKSHRPCEKY